MRNYAYVAGAALAVILSASAQAGNWWISDGTADQAAAADLTGTWRLGLADGATCDLKLREGARADPAADCPASLSAIAEWTLQARDLRLLGPGGRVLASLHARDTGGWRGKASGGRAIVLTAE